MKKKEGRCRGSRCRWAEGHSGSHGKPSITDRMRLDWVMAWAGELSIMEILELSRADIDAAIRSSRRGK